MRYVKLSFAPESGFDYESSGHLAFIRANVVVLTFVNGDYSNYCHKLHVRPWIHNTNILTEIGVKQTNSDRAVIE